MSQTTLMLFGQRHNLDGIFWQKSGIALIEWWGDTYRVIQIYKTML